MLHSHLELLKQILMEQDTFAVLADHSNALQSPIKQACLQ